MTGLPPEIPREVLKQREQLIQIYTKAQRRLGKTLASALLTDFKRFRIQEQLTQVNAIISALNGDVKDALPGMLPGYYKYGTDISSKALDAQGIKLDGLNLGNRVHTAAIQAVAEQMILDLSKANMTMKDTAHRILRQTQQELVSERQINRLIADGLVTGETRRETSERLRRALIKQVGDERFVQAGSRTFSPEYYAELVTRTRTREAVTQGSITRSMEYGVTLFQVSIHDNPCEQCAQYQGKVYSMVPDSGFPMLEARPPYHPFCRHVLLPYVESPTEKGQAKHAALKALSNRAAPITSGGLPEYHKAVAQARETGGLRKKQLPGETRTKPSEPLASPGFGIGRTRVFDAIPTPAYSRLSQELGDRLTIIDAKLSKGEAEIIQEHMAGLSALPEGVMATLAGAGLSRIQIGKGGVASFPGYEDFREVQVPGAPRGTNWDVSRGAYMPGRKEIVLGTGIYGYEWTAQHEIGHALGDLMRYDSSEIVKREYLSQAKGILGRRPEYYPNGSPSDLGQKEFFAESLALVIMDRAKAKRLFGRSYLTFLLETVLGT